MPRTVKCLSCGYPRKFIFCDNDGDKFAYYQKCCDSAKRDMPKYVPKRSKPFEKGQRITIKEREITFHIEKSNRVKPKSQNLRQLDAKTYYLEEISKSKKIHN